jgi:hypothetical protein
MADNTAEPAQTGLRSWLRKRRVKRLTRLRHVVEAESEAHDDVDRLLRSQPPEPPRP